MTDSSDIPAPQTPPTFMPDGVTIYGVKLNTTAAPYGEVKASASTVAASERTVLRLELWSEAASRKPAQALGPADCSIVVAYGYSYEGHCYRFDKPRLLMLRGEGDQPAVGCGFDAVQDGKTGQSVYRMWQLRADQPLMEVQTSLGTVQSLVLDANLPGKRAPNTYDNDMQMAHRGGRLTRD